MKDLFFYSSIFLFVTVASSCNQQPKAETGKHENAVLYKNAGIITAMDSTILSNTDMLVKDGIIESIGNNVDSSNVTVVDLTGKTIIPALISSHVHVGTLKGNAANGENFTRENVLRQLKKYADYGVLMVQSLGTDRSLLFENGLYDSIRSGKQEGARMLSAGWGFGVDKAAPPIQKHEGDDNIFRPQSPDEVKAEMQRLSQYPLSLIKIWVDDFGNPGMTKMKEAVYKTIISEATAKKLRVASHLYYQADAKKLAEDGVAIFAHSIRDTEIDDATIQLMKEKKIAYIPTLALDEFAYIYGEQQPAWLNDPFFKASLEPGVHEFILSEAFKKSQQDPQKLKRNKQGFEIALRNVKKLRDAGILVGMGTDSGAQPLRAQGFAEHRELELLVQAGFTPMQAIQTATINNAQILAIDKEFGSLQKNKVADFIVLNADPLKDIKNTRQIEAVYKAGVKLKSALQ